MTHRLVQRGRLALPQRAADQFDSSAGEARDDIVRPVIGAVRNDGDLQKVSWVVLCQLVLDRRGDAGGLVVRGYEDRDGWSPRIPSDGPGAYQCNNSQH